MSVRSWLRSLTIFQRVLLALVVLAGIAAIARPLTGSPNASGSVINFVVALSVFFLSRLRLWRVRNRLLVSYFLFGVVPLILVVGLVSVTLTTLFGLIAADRVRRELDDRGAKGLRGTFLALVGTTVVRGQPEHAHRVSRARYLR